MLSFQIYQIKKNHLKIAIFSLFCLETSHSVCPLALAIPLSLFLSPYLPLQSCLSKLSNDNFVILFFNHQYSNISSKTINLTISHTQFPLISISHFSPHKFPILIYATPQKLIQMRELSPIIKNQIYQTAIRFSISSIIINSRSILLSFCFQ